MHNILIVANNDNDRSHLRVLLEQYSERQDKWFSIYQVSNSEEAFKTTKIYNFDFIFIDTIIPVMDSIYTKEFIHPNNANAIILISAINDDNEKHSVLSDGIYKYLRKPINMTELKQCLDSFL